MNKVITIEAVRAREADPQHDIDAQARLDAIKEKLMPHQKLVDDLIRAVKREPKPARRIKLLHKVADLVGKAAEGIAPCSSGCSQCCHIPLLINQAEADLIAKETGAPLHKVRNYTPLGDDSHWGEPCPFLRDGACSIYESRPYVCRLHYSLDADALLCTLFENETIMVPYFDQTQYQLLMVEAFGLASTKIADIRKFFPIGKG